MKDLDRVSGLFFLLLGCYTAYESLRLPIGGFRHPGAGFMPLGISIALIALSGILLAGSVKKSHRAGWIRFGSGKTKVPIAVAAFIIYVLVLDPLGYLVSTCLIMALLLRVLEKQTWTVTLTMSLLSVVVTYILFSWWLGVPLPKGIIPI